MDELGKFDLSFTVENKVGNFHKIRLFILISNLSYNEWDIPLPLIKEFIKELAKHVFRWEKLNFKHFGNFVHTTEFLALGKTVNIYINCLMFYPSKQHMKWKHFKYSSLYSTMIPWWTGSKILVWPEMTLGMYLSVWWITSFLRVSYWGKVVEMNFCLIFVKLVILISCWRFFLSLPAESYVMKMYRPCITILEYTSPNKKFENFINIYFHKKTLEELHNWF